MKRFICFVFIVIGSSKLNIKHFSSRLMSSIKKINVEQFFITKQNVENSKKHKNTTQSSNMKTIYIILCST